MLGGVPLVFYIAQLCDFCVFGFAFCSGYGHMVQHRSDDQYIKRLKRLLSVLCNYWLILLVFSVISIIAGQSAYMPGNVCTFIMAVLTLENSYNGAWWYMFAYMLLVIISPLLLKIVEKNHPIIVLEIGFVIYCVAYYIRFDVLTSNWLLLKFGPFGMTLFEYLMGAECCKLQIFTKVFAIWKKLSKPVRWIISVVLMAAMLYGRTKVVQNLFVAPLSGFIVMILFHFWQKPKMVQEIFLLIGRHSTNIWLTHMFFYLAPFNDFVYFMKYPLLIFMFMIAITVSLSVFLQRLEKPIHRKIMG